MMGGLREIDPITGVIRNVPSEIFQPTHVDARGEHLIVVGEVFGEVERVNRDTGAVVDRYEGFDIPHDVLEAADGEIIVAEAGAGRVVRVAGSAPGERSIIVAGLAEPNGLAWAGEESIYVTETAGGRLLRVDLADDSVTVVASALAQPEGVAADPNGGALVVEVAAHRISHVAEDGSREPIAEDLPIGLSNGPSLYRGLAVSESGEVFLTSDIDNTIYRIER
jgi:DNA-binding beta-propeller fold protein YncE